MENTNKKIERANIENTMNNIIQTYDNGITKVKNYLKQAESKTVLVGENQDERTLQAIEIEKQKEKVFDISQKTLFEVSEIINDYNNKEKDFFSLKGELITPDIDLLKIDLSENQVIELQKRYADNYTMLSSINQYAKNKSYPVFEIQKNRTDILDSFNKLVLPRYRENITVPQEKVLFSFLVCAEKYKENFIKQIF